MARIRDANIALSRGGESGKDFGNLLSKRNLADTIFSPLQYNQNTFWRDMTGNLQSFSAEFKDAFKGGFAEAIRGSKGLGDALRDTFVGLGQNAVIKLTNQAVDSLFGAVTNGLGTSGGSGLLKNLLGSLFNKSSGGLIKYASGGYVNMGSGLRDDVPALLGGGEFIVKKRSVNRIGRNRLNKLNDTPQPPQTDRISSGGSSLSALFANEFYGEKSLTRPTKGYFNTSSYLSDLGLTDTNNPQNQLKFAREKYFFDKRQYDKQIKKANDAYEKGLRTQAYTALIGAAVNIGASYLSSSSPVSNANLYNAPAGTSFNNITNKAYAPGTNYLNYGGAYSFRASGGLIKRYNYGGKVFGGDSISDNIPAFLMGG
ncbi:MAG: hypothetical protein AABY22_30665, partial [Nanoarchaeota archaeon]